MRVLGAEAGDSLVERWREWIAPPCQPFVLEAGDHDPLRGESIEATAELRDTFHLWAVDQSLREVWLSEDTFAALPRPRRAALVRAQVANRRGAVPSVGAWADLLDRQTIRHQADGHRFVWWRPLLGAGAEVVRRFVERENDGVASRHLEVPESTWRRGLQVVPVARDLAGTFAERSGPNCFGGVMAACGVPDVKDTWMLQAPFDGWVGGNTRRGGRDCDPGTLLVWRDRAGTAQHAAVTLGDGWAFEKPSQCWATPYRVLDVADLIRGNRTPGQRLERHRIRPPA